MAHNRLYRILSRVTDIRPGEERIAFLLFLYFFLIMTPYGIIKPYRDAKYLNEMGSVRLPLAYLSTAVIMGIFVAFYSRLQVKAPRRILIILSLIFFIVTCTLLDPLWNWWSLFIVRKVLSQILGIELYFTRWCL